MYEGKLQFTVEKQDVGNIVVKRSCKCNCPQCSGRQVWSVHGLMGRVQMLDIGKQVYLVNDVLYVENDEQLAKRLQ